MHIEPIGLWDLELSEYIFSPHDRPASHARLFKQDSYEALDLASSQAFTKPELPIKNTGSAHDPSDLSTPVPMCMVSALDPILNNKFVSSLLVH
jgi:hypothetical protein